MAPHERPPWPGLAPDTISWNHCDDHPSGLQLPVAEVSKLGRNLRFPQNPGNGDVEEIHTHASFFLAFDLFVSICFYLQIKDFRNKFETVV